MIYIANFLLGLLDEPSAFWIFSYLVTKILPPDFYGESSQGVPLYGYQVEKHVIADLAKYLLKLDDKTTEKVLLFLEANAPSMLLPLLTTYCNFEVAFETFNKLILDQDVLKFSK